MLFRSKASTTDLTALDDTEGEAADAPEAVTEAARAARLEQDKASALIDRLMSRRSLDGSRDKIEERQRPDVTRNVATIIAALRSYAASVSAWQTTVVDHEFQPGGPGRIQSPPPHIHSPHPGIVLRSHRSYSRGLDVNDARSPHGVKPESVHTEEGSDEEEAEGTQVEGLYNAKDYQHLNVTAEVKDLFQYIGRYKAHEVELESAFKPFVPDYVPAVGVMDAFVKVLRPDGERDELGLKVLDEPAASQSDATVLELQLRAVSKKQHGDVAVRAIEQAAKNAPEIERWIESIADLHRSRPPPEVVYKKPMPDIETLMQIWPAPVEELLETNALPDADINLDLASYVRTVCAMLDIPVYGSLTEALHVLFTLYSDFKANVHFQQQLETAGDGDGMDGMGMGGMGGMDMSGMDGMSPMGGGEAEQMTFRDRKSVV